MSDSYTTLVEPCEFEIDKVKRSRFIGLAAPCATEEDARAFLAAARSRFHDARHHCSAWRVGDEARSSDDGEPHHSGGPPILREIEGRGLRDVAVVVVRYYGGVKLGCGGLVRAYGGAAAAVLDAADSCLVHIRVPLRVHYDYAHASGIQGVLHKLGIEPAHAEYAARVHLTLNLPPDRVDAIHTQLRDATAGAVELEVLDPIAVPSATR